MGCYLRQQKQTLYEATSFNLHAIRLAGWMQMQTDWLDTFLHASVISRICSPSPFINPCNMFYGTRISFFWNTKFYSVYLFTRITHDCNNTIQIGRHRFVWSTLHCSSSLWISWNVTALEEGSLVHFNYEIFGILIQQLKCSVLCWNRVGRLYRDIGEWWDQPERFSQQRGEQVLTVASFFSQRWCSRCYTFGLGGCGSERLATDAATIDCLTQAFEVTLKRRKGLMDEMTFPCTVTTGRRSTRGQVLDRNKSRPGLV